MTRALLVVAALSACVDQPDAAPTAAPLIQFPATWQTTDNGIAVVAMTPAAWDRLASQIEESRAWSCDVAIRLGVDGPAYCAEILK